MASGSSRRRRRYAGLTLIPILRESLEDAARELPERQFEALRARAARLFPPGDPVRAAVEALVGRRLPESSIAP